MGVAPETLSPWVPPEARPLEVRIALVLSGGISLAVYMSGVVQELLRLQRAARAQRAGSGPNQAYAELLCRTGADLLVDIISGTSAGGLNGIFLAKALASGGDLDAAHATWVEHADIAVLLHESRELAPASLLRAAQFERLLRQALEGIDATAEADAARGHPVLDLYLHTTDVGGRHLTWHDYLGSEIRLKDHRKVFRLRLRRRAHDLSYERNDFADPERGRLRRKNDLLVKLGLATAALPPAFPPVMITRAEAGDLFEPDDADQVYYADGGIMDNRPFKSALEAISRRAASRPVERLLFFVDPNPTEQGPQEAPVPRADAAPSALDLVLGYWTLPRHDTISGSLGDLLDRNRRAGQLRRLLAAAAGWMPPPTREGGLYLGYLELRVEETIARLCSHLRSALQRASAAEPEVALAAWRQHLREQAAWGSPGAASASGWAAFLKTWDVEFAVRRLYHLTTLLGQYAAQAALRPQAEVVRRLGACEEGLWRVMRRLRRREWQLWHPEGAGDEAGPAGPAPPGGAAQRYAHLAPAYREALQAAEAETLAVLAEADAWVRESAPLVEQVLAGRPVSPGRWAAPQEAVLPPADRLWQLDPSHPAYPDLARDVTLAAATQPVAAAEPVPIRIAVDLAELCRRFSDLDLLLYSVARVGDLPEHDPVELVRISPFDARAIDLPGRLKLAGETLGHLGGFLERAWRENDLLWGRLDAAELITRAILKRACERTGNPEHLAAVGPFVRWAQWEILQQELGGRDKAATGGLGLPESAATGARLPPVAAAALAPAESGGWRRRWWLPAHRPAGPAARRTPTWAEYAADLENRPPPGAAEWYHLPARRLLPIVARTLDVAYHMLARGPRAMGWLRLVQTLITPAAGVMRAVGRVLYWAGWLGWVWARRGRRGGA